MDWSRLSWAAFDALTLAALLGTMLAPPDPFTQVLVTGPLLLLTLPATSRYHDRIHGRGWKRHLVFVAAVVLSQVAWQGVPVADGVWLTPAHVGVVLGGVAIGAWLAYFGGLERFGGERDVA